MTRDEIRERVLGILRRIAPDVDPGQIEPGADLREQADLDSMDVLNLVVALEKDLGVQVPETDYARMSTLDDAVDYLAGRTGAG